MSGKQFSMVNRIAWCDSYFVKAGFIKKQPHHSGSAYDAFRIMSLGIRELGQWADKITVG